MAFGPEAIQTWLTTLMVILGQLVVYSFAFIVRLAGYGFHTAVLGRQISERHDEILRIGNDLVLMSLGVFLGISATSRFGMVQVAELVIILLVYLFTYVLFLFLENKTIGEVFREKRLKQIFMLNMLIGWVVLGFAARISVASITETMSKGGGP